MASDVDPVLVDVVAQAIREENPVGAARTAEVAVGAISAAWEPTRDDVRAAVERVSEDFRRRAIYLSDDTVPTVMSWYDAHRLHGDDPYIGCPFCRDRFELKR